MDFDVKETFVVRFMCVRITINYLGLFFLQNYVYAKARL